MLNIYDPHLMDIGEPHLILSLLVLDEHPMPHRLPTLPPAHRACLSLAQFTSSLKNLCLLLLAAPVLLIAHNFDFWNWRTVLRLILSSNFGGQLRLFLWVWRTGKTSHNKLVN